MMPIAQSDSERVSGQHPLVARRPVAQRRPCPFGRARRAGWALGLAAAIGWGSAAPRAEDSDRLRPYLHLRSAEFNTAWDVLDSHGLGFGVNLNRHWGIEFAADFYEYLLKDSVAGTLGEQGIWHFIPQVRYRYPLMSNKLVPYLIAGIGPNRTEFNDRHVRTVGTAVDADGGTFTVAFGGGIEYFLVDSVAFGIEAKYLWTDPYTINIGGRERELDMSATLLTVGLRAYLSETRPQPRADSLSDVPTRLYAGLRLGVGTMTGDRMGSDIKLVPESSGWGPLNQIYGVTLGANFGRHLGVEISGESMEWEIRYQDRGQVTEYAFVPVLVNLRLRYPLGDGRWVPFVMAGGGGAYGEKNDLKAAGADLDISGSGIYPAIGVGAGFEYFVTRHVSVGLEARWNHSWGHEISIAGVTHRGDLSNWQAQLGVRMYLFEF